MTKIPVRSLLITTKGDVIEEPLPKYVAVRLDNHRRGALGAALIKRGLPVRYKKLH